MAKKIQCRNCGKEIQSDFLSCPYCRMDLEETFEVDTDDEPASLEEEDIEEYYEEDDYSTEENTQEADYEEEDELGEEEYEEEYFEDDEYFKDDEDNEAETIEENSPAKENKEQKNSDNEFQPIKATFVSPKKTKVNMKEDKQKPYNANADHYYDDVLPQVLDDINNNTLEFVAKVVGIVILLIFVMWYLIYFL